MFDFKLDEKVVETAALAPKVFVEASLGEGGEYKREPGIQLTKEQILSLRRYELLGLSLPYRTNDVAAYLNYGPGEVGQPGLTVMDFFTTFSAVYNHARRWSPLREKIQLTGVHLQVFAGTMIEYGKGVFEVYEDLKSSGYLEKHDITTVEEYLQLQNEFSDLPDLTLAPSDVPDIKYFLNVMLVEVRRCHAKAEEVRQGLDSFGADLRERVLPQIKLRLLAVSGNSYGEGVLGIQKDIDQRADELDDLNKQYHQMVRESIESAAGLHVGGLIMSIYVGVKAEQLRTRYNELKTAQDMDMRKLASKSQTLSSLNSVRDYLQILSTVTVEAEVATQNLMLVWNALSQFLTDSVRALDQVQDAVRLRHFIRHLKLVVSPWEQNIEPSSRALLAVFEAAQKEIDTSHSSQERMAPMYLMSNVSDYPAVDVAALFAHNVNVQNASTQTQLLAQQYDYLPDVVSRMTAVAAIVNGQVFGLRNRAQTTINDLNKTREIVKRCQQEAETVQDEADKEDLRLEMEIELQRTFRAVTGQANELKQIQLNLSTRYDRSASAQWVLALEQDLVIVEEQKNRAEAKREEILERMKLLSEAIDLVGSNRAGRLDRKAQLTEESMVAMGLAPPQVQIALLAIDALKKMVTGIGETISYLAMVDGYNRLKERAGQFKISVAEKNKAICATQGKITLIGSLDNLDNYRWDYVKEFASVVDAFEKISCALERESSLSVEAHASNLLDIIPGVIFHLRPIQLTEPA